MKSKERIINKMQGLTKEELRICSEADTALSDVYARIDRIALSNTQKVMKAFAEHRISEMHFQASTGYGYDDPGREAIEQIYAEVFGTEAALVRHTIVNGTQALTIGLFGLLRPGDTLLSVTGKPYDTLEEVIGLTGEAGNGSLKDFGVSYRQCEIGESFEHLLDDTVKVVYIQRSRGYGQRRALSPDEIDEITDYVHANSKAFVMVDNCYGEFTCEKEPRADLICGSLIKNPGGGIALTGGYLAGTKRAVELASYRMTSPGVGGEVGCTLGQNRSILLGFFMAPHVVAQALKTAAFAAYVYEKAGYDVSPKYAEPRYDLIQTLTLRSPEKLCRFCQAIQRFSPVDSHVTPEPWAMPGYTDQVIMAAGTFTGGATSELSADAPMRDPYTVFMQGALTFESGKLAILGTLRENT
ncbi:MAG: methionine gamma-lyase family protein [Clostridia bacterium]|nr:methionine gamma-lyase family protein [Clostridia bacterium]